MSSKRALYMKLFLSTFYISAFTFGGGYVIIPLMKKRFVDDLHWIEEKEIINLITIAQSSPGAVAVNASILLGYQIAGIPGALISIMGTILPPFFILTAISFFYASFRDNLLVRVLLKGMQAGIAAVILSVVIDLGKNVLREKSVLFVAVILCAFVGVFFFEINVVYIILLSGLVGFLRVYVMEKGTPGKGGRL